MKKLHRDRYELDDDMSRLDFARLEDWLSKTYWSPGIGAEEIRKGAVNSALVIGCYDGGEQCGFLRVAGDKTRFAYVMDVYVDARHRNRGIARALLRFALEHPELRDVYQWVLATSDAHAVYAGLGFQPLPEPARWMMLRREVRAPRAPI